MAVVIVLITLVMDILIGGGALRPVHIKVLVLLIVLVVVFGQGDDHVAAYRDGGHADLYSVSDYIGCGGVLRPVLLGTNMDETQVLHSLSQSRYSDRTAWLMSIDCFWNCF